MAHGGTFERNTDRAIVGKYFKKNYKNKLANIDKRIDYINELENKLKQKKYDTYGSPDSPFYGLHTPSLPKIIEYMCDTYKLPYDVMMDMVYDNIMKRFYNLHLQETFSHLKSGFIKSIDDLKSIDYDYDEKNYRVGGETGWSSVKFTTARRTDIWRCFHTYHSGGVSHSNRNYCYNKLYCGGLPYSTIMTRNGCVSGITIKSKKKLMDTSNVREWDIFDPDDVYGKKFVWKKHNDKIQLFSKQDIVEQLNKLEVKFKLSWGKEKLMILLMEN